MLKNFLRRFTLTDLFMWLIGAALIFMVVYGSVRTLSQKHMFSAGLEFTAELDRGVLPVGLQEEFQNQGRVLIAPIEVRIEQAGQRWDVEDANTIYHLRKTNRVLDVYVGSTYKPTEWVNLSIAGIALGGIYALIALGYTMVYGILRMINFAHGEVFMSGPFTAYFLANALDKSGFFARQPIISLLLVGVLSAGISTGVAILLERIAYRPLRMAPRLVPLITAIGASFFLQYVFRGLFGSGIKGYPEIKEFQTPLGGGGDIRIMPMQVLVIAVTITMMVGLMLFTQYTKTGKSMRAVSEDKETAALMGINVDRVIATTFAIGGALAGIAGVLYAFLFRQVNFFMGFVPGIKAFTAAVLGGIGNPAGAMLGGFVLGIFEGVGPNLFLDGLGIPAPYQLKDAIAYTMLVLILIFRPTGILGERLARKKA